MSLAQRQADQVTVVTDLQNAVRACDVDINANDPDAVAIQRLKEMFMSALDGLGFSSGTPA
jgi:hypothetical protein